MAQSDSAALKWLGGHSEGQFEFWQEDEDALATSVDMTVSEWESKVLSRNVACGKLDDNHSEGETETDLSWSCLDIGTPSDSASDAIERCESTADFTYQREETIIIFDWDDTLCPTTACTQRGADPAAGHPPDELAATLGHVTGEAEALLERAMELAGKVIIVTNACEGWVEMSCQSWLPELQSVVQFMDVTSARSEWEPVGVETPTGWKACAFEDAIEQFYAYQDKNWKNVIVVGDAPYEHDALQRVMERAAGGRGKTCRSKSVRFVQQPSFDSLAAQLRLLRDDLQDIVNHDGNVDTSFFSQSL